MPIPRVEPALQPDALTIFPQIRKPQLAHRFSLIAPDRYRYPVQFEVFVGLQRCAQQAPDDLLRLLRITLRTGDNIAAVLQEAEVEPQWTAVGDRGAHESTR